MKTTYKGALAGAVSVFAIVAASSAFAGSFALKERSTIGQGLSFAGVTGGSAGIESMGFNPAAIGLVEDLEMSGGLAFIKPIANGTVVSGAAAGQTVDADSFAGLANGYIGYRLEPDILIGLASYTPFGLVTQYEPTDVVAGDAITSKLQTFIVAPTAAFQPIEELTLAASMNITYVDARLTSSTAIVDGQGGFELSFGVGALWEPTDSTKIGVAYQHGYNLDISGTLNGAPATATAALPSTISAGIVQGITDDFRVMGEIQWQNWSVFDSIDISVTGVGLVAQDFQNYDDAFFVALGGEYDVTDDLTVRLGAAWDQTPTNDDILPGTPPALGITNRTARVPDEDRVWISIGGSYDVDEHMTLNAGYSYLFTLEDSVVGLRTAPGTRVEYDGGAHIFSVGGSMKF